MRSPAAPLPASPPAVPAPGWLGEATAVFVKDWRLELRHRQALTTVLLFAVTTLLMVSLALGPIGVSTQSASVLPVILWIILLFAAAAGLPRGFVQEEDTHTATPLRLAATASAVYAGKLLYNLTLLVTVQVILVPLFWAVVQLPVPGMGVLLAGLAAGAFGLAAASTLVSAMVAQAAGRGALFPILAFPILIPLLLLAVEITRAAVTGSGHEAALGQLLLYDGTLLVGGLMLFPLVWNP